MSTMNPSQVAPSAVERADALLARWGQRLSPAGQPKPQGDAEAAREHLQPAGQTSPPEPGGSAARRADTLLDRLKHRMSGRGLVEATAYGYVALAVKTGKAADAVQATWQESVQAARRQQERQAAQAGGASAAHQVAADEKKGEQILTRTATDATKGAEEGVDVAADAAA